MVPIEQLARQAYETAQTRLMRSAGLTQLDFFQSWEQLYPDDKAALIAATRHIVEQANQVH